MFFFLFVFSFQATELLKKAEGVVTLTVCNPNESKTGQDQDKQKDSAAQKTPQKAASGELKSVIVFE